MRGVELGKEERRLEASEGEEERQREPVKGRWRE